MKITTPRLFFAITALLIVAALFMIYIREAFNIRSELAAQLLTFGVALFVVGGVFGLLHLRLRGYMSLLIEMRKKYPVAYFAAPPFAQNIGIVTSDETHVRYHSIAGNKPVEVFVLDREPLRYERGRLNVGLARTTEGVIITSVSDESLQVPLNICRDKLNILYPPKKDNELDEAVDHIRSGT